MDAISFVLGIKSSHLRSTHLRDLVYRGRVLRTSKIGADGDAIQDDGTNGANGLTNGHTQDGEEQGTQSSSQRNDPQTAWVMAVYEDDAGEEQKWKRSITSAGQSEYRINNRVVGAKQYNEALEAENILIKARNFLVFQGDVEAIANQNPKDLTRLIEQISGSVEYKADYERLKAEAEKAGEDQGYKLNQRRAINSEIKQYQEQKREADNYQRKLEERDQAIVSQVLFKLFHFQRAIEESSAEIQRHQEELKEHRRGVEKYEQRVEDAKKEQSRVAKEVSKASRHIKAKEKETEEKENSLLPIDEKISISNRNLQKYKTRIDEISKERNSQSRNVEQLEKDLATIQKAESKWLSDWQQATQQSGRQLSNADLQEYNKLHSQVTKLTGGDQQQIESITRSLKTDEETANSLKSKLDAAQGQVQRLDTEIKDLRDRRDTLNAQTKQTRKDIDSKKNEYNNLASERRRAEQMHTELDEKLREVLRKLVDADDGRRESNKEQQARETLAAMKRIFPGVRGRMHELCKPKQQKYREAVSTVLGRHFDAVVVDTEKTAKDCIQYLRDQRAGQATFIPLDTIQVKAVSSNLKGMHRGMRLAIDVVDYEHAVERAISYACGNAMVCDDIKVAKHLVFDRNVEAKAVTLDGVVIHKGGLMTGGRGPQDRNARKWEDSEIEKLKKLRDKLMADIQALPKSHRPGMEEENIQSELAGMETQLTYLQEEVRALERNMESKKKEYNFAKKLSDETKPKYQNQAQTVQGLKNSLKQHKDKVGKVEDDVFADFCQRLGYDNIRAYDVQQGSLQQEAAQKKLEFTTQRSRLENQLVFETQRLESTKDRVKTLEDQAKRDEKLIKSLQAEKKLIADELKQLNKELESLQTQLEKLNEQNTEHIEKVDHQKRELAVRSKNIDSTLREILSLEAQVQKTAAARYAQLRKCKIDEIKIPLAASSAKLDNLPLDDVISGGADPNAMDVDEDPDQAMGSADAVQDYGIEPDFDQLDDELKDEEAEDAESKLQEEIVALNAELEKMAPNMRAVERLEGTESRLKATERDFEAARRAAKRAKDDFEEVKEKRLDLFNKAYQHIADSIGQVYKELTKSSSFPMGGSAYLDKEDEDEPYLSGLKYHAMPPLKRFRDMEHLSGGEKTMAALALLFSIHSYQPSPFFVLDEVDAALDNVNVQRVAKYVSEHAGPGMQFVVISLKTGFFQCSETLVGIMRDQVVNSSRALTLDVSTPRVERGHLLTRIQLRKYQEIAVR